MCVLSLWLVELTGERPVSGPGQAEDIAVVTGSAFLSVGVNHFYAGQPYNITKGELLQSGQCREQFV